VSDHPHGTVAVPGRPVPQRTDVSEATARLLGAGVPTNTRRAYAADRREWVLFTQGLGVAPLPVAPEVLAEFVTGLLTRGSPAAKSPRPLAASSVERRLSALSTLSVEQGHGRPDLRAAWLILRGHRRSTTAAAPRQAAPVTVPVLRALVAQARSRGDAGSGGDTTLRELRDVALVLLGFAVGARRSELVAIDLEDLRDRPEGLQVAVHRTKTSDHTRPVSVPWATDASLCPVRATQALRAGLAQRGIEHGPLFRRITRTDAVLHHRLTGESVADVVAGLASSAGVPVPDGFAGYSGHSLRRGFATEARRAGADPLRIARQGGWADNSASLARYLADVDQWADHPLAGVL
jgi:integrase